MQKLKVGDTVQVMKGAERTASAKRGKVLFIDKEKGRVRVEGEKRVRFCKSCDSVIQ
ncbi:MAG TPA: KOW motif domain-containing protein [Myxococcaceae bacterium]|nr:KOW motif domain-containing protein [Myxococcaceae bacterium]